MVAERGEVMAISPTQRSLKLLRDEGWTVSVVEYWQAVPGHPGGGVRKDLFGFGDLLALREGDKPLIVQTTSGANLAARRDKIDASDAAKLWLTCGGRIEIHGWRKLKPRGQKVAKWAGKREEYT
jgi:hypothetical protein